MEVIDLLRRKTPQWPALIWLIVICVAIFIAVRVAAVSGDGDISRSLVDWLALPSDAAGWLRRPWTALTYMFTHYEVMHLLLNMLWLYWFGTLMLTIATGRRLAAVYIAGGLAGAAVYMLYGLIAPSSAAHSLIGASAAVLAVVTATTMMMPRLKLHLMLIGPVEIRWIALAIMALDVAALGGGNIGSHVAHLAGAGAGVAFVVAQRHLSEATRRPLRSAPRPHRGAIHDDKAELDRLLDKIRLSGYSSLTSDERRTLFEISRK